MGNSEIVKYEDWFSNMSVEDREANGHAINRIAFSKENFDFVCERIIPDMLALGMEIYIDEMGSIRGVMKLGNGKGKHIASGSHHDSVKNGDEFDGYVGCYASLKMVENLKASKDINGYYSAVCISSEESTPDKKACAASSWYAGVMSLEDYDKRVAAIEYSSVNGKIYKTMR